MTEIPEGCVNVRNAGSIIDRPLLNSKWMLPNSTIVLSTRVVGHSTRRNRNMPSLLI